MNLAFVRGCSTCEQCRISFIERDSNASHGKFDGHTTALKSATQYCNAHSIPSVEQTRFRALLLNELTKWAIGFPPPYPAKPSIEVRDGTYRI
jgi:hypothetical protein